MSVGLIGARLLHEGALLVFFGVACFPFYAPLGSGPSHLRFAAWSRRRLAWAATLALAGGVGWLAFTAADMSGTPGDAFNPAALSDVITGTDFGKLWAARLIGCGVLVLATLWSAARWALAPLAGLLLASLAGTGHANLPENWLGLVHQVGDAAHLLAAGAWIGALWALGWMVVHMPQASDTEAALRRFSGVGQAAVAVLVLTGGLNAYAILGDVQKLATTRYGQILDVKLIAFTGMLGLAALNRFVLTPRLAHGPRPATIARLKAQILGEQLLSFVVILVVAVIGTMDPNG